MCLPIPYSIINLSWYKVQRSTCYNAFSPGMASNAVERGREEGLVHPVQEVGDRQPQANNNRRRRVEEDGKHNSYEHLLM